MDDSVFLGSSALVQRQNEEQAHQIPTTIPVGVCVYWRMFI